MQSNCSFVVKPEDSWIAALETFFCSFSALNSELENSLHNVGGLHSKFYFIEKKSFESFSKGLFSSERKSEKQTYPETDTRASKCM